MSKNKIINASADKMLGEIGAVISNSLKTTPRFSGAIVEKVNENGTVNIYFPPDSDVIFTNISNQTPFSLAPGDSVEVTLKNGSYTNCWISAKHGATKVRGQAEDFSIDENTIKHYINKYTPSFFPQIGEFMNAGSGWQYRAFKNEYTKIPRVHAWSSQLDGFISIKDVDTTGFYYQVRKVSGTGITTTSDHILINYEVIGFDNIINDFGVEDGRLTFLDDGNNFLYVSDLDVTNKRLYILDDGGNYLDEADLNVVDERLIVTTE